MTTFERRSFIIKIGNNPQSKFWEGVFSLSTSGLDGIVPNDTIKGYLCSMGHLTCDPTPYKYEKNNIFVLANSGCTIWDENDGNYHVFSCTSNCAVCCYDLYENSDIDQADICKIFTQTTNFADICKNLTYVCKKITLEGMSLGKRSRGVLRDQSHLK